MTRYVALLRGVNVGGRHQVPMARLRELAEDLGYDDVATYVQSGNLVLSSSAKADAVGAVLSEALQQEFGFTVDVVMRSAAQIAAIINKDVLGDIADDDAKRAVGFLAGKPSPKAVKALDSDEFSPEQFAVVGSELYLWCPNGLGRSKLAAAPWHRRLGVPLTVRNWRTVTKLLAMLDAA